MSDLTFLLVTMFALITGMHVGFFIGQVHQTRHTKQMFKEISEEAFYEYMKDIRKLSLEKGENE